MKIIDQLYYCQIPQVFEVWQLQCRLRIFQPHNKVQTVVITNMEIDIEMGFEMNWFIPYVINQLIDHIVKEFCLEPAKLIWIEHYTPGFRQPSGADLSQVTFDWHNEQAINPRWQALAPKAAQALISQDLLPA